MAEEIKDLGGLVNQDIAFSKLPPGAVYDSENFRVITTDGATTGARENIKGTVEVARLDVTQCVQVFTLDTVTIKLTRALIVGRAYRIDISVDGAPAAPFTFTYSNDIRLITNLANYISVLSGGGNVTGGIQISGSSFTIISPTCKTFSNLRIVEVIPPTPTANNSKYYKLMNEEFAYPYNANNSPIDPDTNLPLPYNPWAFNLHTNTGNSNGFWPPNFSYVNGVNTGIPALTTGAFPTLLEYKDINTTGATRTIRFQGYPQNANAGSTPIKFWTPASFPLGPHQAAFSYYFENTDIFTGAVPLISATLKVWLDFGPFVSAFNAGPISTESTTVFGSTRNALKLFDVDLLQASNRSRLGPGPGNNLIVNYTLPSSLAALGGEVPGAVIIEVRIERDANANAPNTQWDLQFYFDYLKFLGPGPSSAIPPDLLTVNTISSPSIGGNIIGWTALRDKIYLFTTDGVFDPDDPTTWGGSTPPVTNDQIWEFTYNKAGNYTLPADVPPNFAPPYGLKQIYQNNLRMTKFRPIANPGMIESRYESPAIQKIYWTDNYNVPRQINVAAPNVAALTPEELNLQPSLSMDLPLITQVIDGGNLLVGVYQVAYRLKNVNGAETRFSRTSQLVPILVASESGADVKSYFPTTDIGSNANKSIRVRVENVDTSYDTIEFVLIYYADDSSIPTIQIAAEEFISGPIADVIISNAGTLIDITADEFTAFNSSIVRCKTLAAKKQTLFLGNITVSDQVINFDARTYRFPLNSTSTTIRDNSIDPPQSLDYTAASNFFAISGVGAVPRTHGAYQTYDDQNPRFATSCLYQPGTNILGGQGPNVKYEFFTETIALSPVNSTPPAAGGFGVTNPLVLPNSNVVINFSIDSVGRTYSSDGSSLSSYASPYVYDIYIGYRRDEMYRFGIVFFDELDNPTYVNWIGDIRMPHAFMPSATANSSNLGNRSLIGDSLNADFTSSPAYLWENPGNPVWNDLYAKPLGVKFTINFSSVASKYKKAAIVRAPLEDKDKHILGQGIFLPTYKTDGLGAPDSEHVFLCTNYTLNAADPFPFGGNCNEIWPDCFTFRSPEFLFKPFPGFVGTDTIDVFGVMKATKFDYLMGQQSPNSNSFSKAFEVPYHNSGGGNHRFTATISCAYDLLESATYPATIKNNLSQNPYELATAFLVSAAGANRNYDQKGNTTSANGGGSVRTLNNCSPKDLTAPYGGGISTPNLDNNINGGFSYGNRSLFLQLKSNAANNWNLSGFGGHQFYNIDPWQNTGNRYVANYKRNVVDPYGGQDYFSRADTEYIPCNNLIDISNKTNPITTKVFGGDTRISVFDHVANFIDRAEGVASGNNTLDMFTEYLYMPVETSVAVEYRRSANDEPFSTSNYTSGVPNRNWVFCAWGNVGSADWYSGAFNKLESSEYFFVDSVFNYSKKSLYTYFPEPALGSVPTTYDCRVWRSERKIDGELLESWSIFKPLSFLDVESAYGPINNLVVFQDKLYYFQDRGFGVLQVADQKLITDAGGAADLVLGNSGLLERYDYISTKTGTKHQFSMHVSDYSMIWFDVLARKMYRFKPGALEPVSDIKGFNAYLYERTKNTLQIWDNPYIFKGIHSTYDYRYNEFYMTFLNQTTDTILGETELQFTLVYNDLMDGYVGKYTFYPKVYINDKINIFSTYGSYNNDSIFMHNVGNYGKFHFNSIVHPSKLSFVVNANPTVEKTFTNLEFVVDVIRRNAISSVATTPLNLDPYSYKPLAELQRNEFFDVMRVYNTYQNTDWQPLSQLSRRHKNLWNVKVPTDRVIDLDNFFSSGNIFDPSNLETQRPKFTKRLKDKWFVVDLSYSNNTGNKIVAYTAKAIYTPNSR